MNAVLLIRVLLTMVIQDAKPLSLNFSKALLKLDMMNFNLSVAIMTEGTSGAIPDEVFLPINYLIIEQVCPPLFQETIEEVLNVLHELNLQAINCSTIQTVRFSHVVDKVLYLEAHFLFEASTDDPKFDNSSSHWSVIVLDPINFVLLEYLLLLGLILKFLRLIAVLAYIFGVFLVS